MAKPKKDKEFWPINIYCQEHRKALSLAEVAFSSDGRVAIVGKCDFCGTYTAVVDTWEHIMQYCGEKEGLAMGVGNDLIN